MCLFFFGSEPKQHPQFSAQPLFVVPLDAVFEVEQQVNQLVGILGHVLSRATYHKQCVIRTAVSILVLVDAALRLICCISMSVITWFQSLF